MTRKLWLRWPWWTRTRRLTRLWNLFAALDVRFCCVERDCQIIEIVWIEIFFISVHICSLACYLFASCILLLIRPLLLDCRALFKVLVRQSLRRHTRGTPVRHGYLAFDKGLAVFGAKRAPSVARACRARVIEKVHRRCLTPRTAHTCFALATGMAVGSGRAVAVVGRR